MMKEKLMISEISIIGKVIHLNLRFFCFLSTVLGWWYVFLVLPFLLFILFCFFWILEYGVGFLT